MDQREYEEYLKNRESFVAAEKAKAEDEARKRAFDKKYDPAEMDCEKMPLGCWVILLAIGFLLFSAGVGLTGKMFHLF